jgi:trigger factor
MAEQQEQAAAKNTVTVEQSGPCRKKVIVEIPRETISKATDEQYEYLRKEAMVPGFRRGRSPRRLLEKRFGKEAGETVKLKLLAEASDAAIKDSKLDILGEPEIDHEKIELPAEGPLKFDFEVEVRPEFELPKLEGIAVNKSRAEVTEGHIDREIEVLRRYFGTWTPKEGGKVEAEDMVIADAMLNIEGQEQKLDNIEIYARPNGFVGDVPVEKLDELLAGAKAGEVKTLEVTVPRTYFKEELRGKKVEIRLAVKDIKWLKPAELNEDFIAKCGAKSEEELRKAVRERLQGRLESQAKSEMADQIYKHLLDNTSFDLPVEVAADQANALLRRQYVNLMMQGVAREQIDEHIEQLKAGSEERAKEQLKVFFIMGKVAEKLEIKTTEEEINGHIAQLAIQRKVRPERLKEEMQRDGSLEQFKVQVLEQKCIAELLKTAKITEVERKAEPEKREPSRRKRAAEKVTKKPAEKLVKKTPAAKKTAAKTVDEEKPERKAKTTTQKKKT